MAVIKQKNSINKTRDMLVQDKIRELKLKKLEILNKKQAHQDKNLIEYFNSSFPLVDGSYLRANPKQQLILNAWNNPIKRSFVYVGGNRCLHGDTLIFDPILNTSIPVSKIKENFHVLSWNGKKLVPAFAFRPFAKEPDEMFVVETESGHSFTASAGHSVLTPGGFLSISELRPGCAVFLPQTNLDTYRSARVLNAPSFWKTTQDSQSGCPAYYGFYDEQLLQDQGNDQVAVPSQGGVSGHISFVGCGRMGGRDNIQEYIRPCQLSPHHSTLDDLQQPLDRCAEYLSRSSYRCDIHADCCTRSVLQPTHGYADPFQSTAESSQSANRSFCTCNNHDNHCSKLNSPFHNVQIDLVSTTIVSNITKSYKSVKWDIHVPIYNNYYAQGFIHHNSGKTTLGCILSVCTTIGEWPWSGEKLFFSHKFPRRTRILCQSWESSAKEVIVPELHKWWPQKREVEIRKNNVGVEAFWTDKKTGSTIEILSTGGESLKVEGWSGDFLYFDEPVPRDHYIACTRGLVDRGGKEIFCMTLLDEAWIDREIVKKTTKDGLPDPSIFVVETKSFDNVGYGISQNNLDYYISKLTEEEYEARINGVPKYKSGLVYQMFKREIHVKPRTKTPLDWPVDVAIDTHPRKPHSVLFMATSPRGFKYCIHEIREYGDGKSLAESIVRVLNWGKYRVNRVIIDPLSKGDANSDPEGTTFQKAADVFGRYDILLETASKNKDTGVLMVKEYLKSANEEASLFFFNDLVYTIREMEGLMWEREDEKEKIQKVDDDMAENLYRLILLETQYTLPPPTYDSDEHAVRDVVNKTTGY